MLSIMHFQIFLLEFYLLIRLFYYKPHSVYLNVYHDLFYVFFLFVVYRKRKEEEMSKMLKYSNEDLVKEILPIVDNFERAINMDDDNLEDEVSKFLSGFKMIYCKLISTLEKYEVKAIDGNNKPFDPTYHQAVMTESKEGVEPGMVLEVLQKGYLLKDKVIRPAMVKVSE